MAGAWYLLSVLLAVSNEFLLHHGLGVIGIFGPVFCYFVSTLFLCRLFWSASRNAALLAALFQFAALALEALEFQFAGINIAMPFHGLFCLAFGYLIFKSRLVPVVLGASAAFAGLVWMTYLVPALVSEISPLNTAVGLAAESLSMLWLFVMGVDVRRWAEFAQA